MKKPRRPVAKSSRGGRPLAPAEIWFTGQDENARWHLYSDAYRWAADCLVDKCKEASPQFLIYPITYLYRQYLEIALKKLLIDNGSLLSQPPTSLLTHDLLSLWQLFLELAGRLTPALHSCRLQKMETWVRFYSQHDPYSQAWRYPVDRRGQLFLTRLRRVDPRKLKRAMTYLDEGLAHVRGLAWDLRENQCEGNGLDSGGAKEKEGINPIIGRLGACRRKKSISTHNTYSTGDVVAV